MTDKPLDTATRHLLDALVNTPALAGAIVAEHATAPMPVATELWNRVTLRDAARRFLVVLASELNTRYSLDTRFDVNDFDEGETEGASETESEPVATTPRSFTALRATRTMPDAGQLQSAPLTIERRPGAVPAARPESSPRPPMPEVRVQFVVPNARAGEPYQGRLEIRRSGAGTVEVLGIEQPAALALTFDAETGLLTGLPSLEGDHPFTVLFRVAGDSAEVRRQEASLAVIPNPRRLWQSLPPDPDAPFPKADSEHNWAQGADGWALVGASTRGRSHAHAGTFRDDDFGLTHLPATAWSVLAVADGAGSAPFSREGSRQVVSAAVALLGASLEGEAGRELASVVVRSRAEPEAKSALGRKLYGLLGGAALAGLRALEDRAAAAQLAARDFATTLLLAIHLPTPDGHFVATFTCGDGVVAAYDQHPEGGSQVVIMGEADAGEFAGQTRFLDRALLADNTEIARRIRARMFPSLSAVILLTDGVSDPKFDSERAIQEAGPWDRLWQELLPHLATDEPGDALLGFLDFWSPGNHDDRTAVVLWNRMPREGAV